MLISRHAFRWKRVGAKLEWGRVSAELHKLGLLSNLDRAALAAYCSSYGQWVRTEREPRKLEAASPLAALVQKSRTHGFVGNPLSNVSRRAAAAMIRYAAEFGMTPSARARVDGVRSGGQDDPATKSFTTAAEALEGWRCLFEVSCAARTRGDPAIHIGLVISIHP